MRQLALRLYSTSEADEREREREKEVAKIREMGRGEI